MFSVGVKKSVTKLVIYLISLGVHVLLHREVTYYNGMPMKRLQILDMISYSVFMVECITSGTKNTPNFIIDMIFLFIRDQKQRKRRVGRFHFVCGHTSID